MTSSRPSRRRESADGRWVTGQMFRVDLASRTADTVASYDQMPPEPAVRTGTPLFRHGGLVSTARGRVRLRAHGQARTGVAALRRHDPPDHALAPGAGLHHSGGVGSMDRLHARRLHAGPGMTEAMVEQSLDGFEFVGDEPEPLFGRSSAMSRAGYGSKTLRILLQDAELYRDCARRTWLGVFEPPAGFSLLATAGGRVLGVETDEMEVESVAVYEVLGW